jgi:flagellar hook protein FlgE
MGLASALYSSVSGLDVASTAITVTGDNIANVNTPAFKERRAEFADVLGQSIASVGGFSQLGAGAKVQRVSTVFSQGTFENTGRGTDLAIEGAGFFLVDSSQGRSYTRAGLFNFDAQGFLVNPEGMRVQGFGIDPLTGLSNGQLGDIQVSTALSPPQPTSDIQVSVNLDSSSAPIPGGFDPANPNGSSHFRMPITVYDTQGNGHTATVFYTKVATNTWDVTVGLAPADAFDPVAAPGDQFVIQGSTQLVFDNSGLITSITPSNPNGTVTIPFEFSGLAGNPVQSVGLSFGNIAGAGVQPTTQLAANSATNSFVQDGYAPGSLQAISIDREGYITGQFSNGESINLSQLALANFPNVEQLQAVGNNRLIESRGSGQPIIGPAQSGNFGAIRASSLEQSNVDLATQFVRLIIHQRAFQANTRTVSVTNELLATLNNLGQ